MNINRASIKAMPSRRVPEIVELRDPDVAGDVLRQALWLQRVRPATMRSVAAPLSWALEIVAGGEPLPPLGLVADVGHLVLGRETEERETDRPAIPDWPAADVRIYDDYVLGKLYADTSFERGADAVAHYSSPREQTKALAFLIGRFRERAGIPGLAFSPGILKDLLQLQADKVVGDGWQALTTDGLHPVLKQLYAELIPAVRNAGSALSGVDVFELEHGTAVAEFGQRIALRQTLEIAALFEAELPTRPERPVVRRRDVATRILDEDLYPIGGFTSISNRGTIESLLHSQLAYMESAADERPDLFDIKFLRDELLYYARDENQFFRRRRTFVLALFPDLVTTRVKHPDLPAQHIVLLLAMVVVMVRKLVEWLTDEALTFEILFVAETETSPLGDERELIEMMLREQLENGTVTVETIAANEIAALCAERSRRSLCQAVLFATRDRQIELENTLVTHVTLDGAVPRLTRETNTIDGRDEESAWERWATIVRGVVVGAL